MSTRRAIWHDAQKWMHHINRSEYDVEKLAKKRPFAYDFEPRALEPLRVDLNAPDRTQYFCRYFISISILCSGLSAICDKVFEQVIPLITIYGEIPMDMNSSLAKDDIEISISKFFPHLVDAYKTKEQLKSLVLRLLRVIHLRTGDKSIAGSKRLNHQKCWDTIILAFAALVSLQRSFDSNMLLLEHWSIFKRFDEAQDKLKHIDNMVEGDMLGDIIEGVKQEIPAPDFQSNLKAVIDIGTLRLHRQGLKDKTLLGYQWIGIAALSVLLFRISHQKENDKFLKRIIKAILTHAVVIPLVGPTVWISSVFFQKYTQHIVSSVSQKQYLTDLITNFDRKLNYMAAQFERKTKVLKARWNSTLADLNDIKSTLTARMVLLEQAKLLVKEIIFELSIGLGVHLQLEVPLKAELVNPIVRLISCVQLVETDLIKFASFTDKLLIPCLQHLRLNAFLQLYPLQTKLETMVAEKNDKEAPLALGYLKQLIIAFEGPLTDINLCMAEHVLLNLELPKDISDIDQAGIMMQLRRITDLIRWKSIITLCQSNQLLYWNRTLIPLFFEQCVDDKHAIPLIQLFFGALNNTANALHNFDGKLSNYFTDYVINSFIESFLDPITVQVEEVARVKIHNLLHSESNMIENYKLKTNFKELEQLGTLCIGTTKIKPMEFISDSLHEIWYNLSALSPREWQKNQKMKFFANQYFRIRAMNYYLPRGSLEQSSSLFEILRKLSYFIKHYHYDSAQQYFVQGISKGKNLQVVGIIQIADTIKCSGFGIVNSAVDYSYQALRKKITALSDMLYDDHVKSLLMREFRELKGNDSGFEYDRAELIYKSLRQLKSHKADVTTIDAMRILLTHIGNLIGLIRLFRTATMHVLPLEAGAIAEGLQGHDLASVENVKAVCKASVGMFDQLSNLFRTLFNAFSAKLRDPRNIHLKYFHILVPALSICYSEHIYSARETLHNQSDDNNGDLVLADDGFAVGTVFLLNLLDQENKFNDLRWFLKAEEHFTSKFAKVNDATPSSVMPKNTISKFMQEFGYLNSTFSSSRMLFY